MLSQGFWISLKVMHIEQEGACCCTECHGELAAGNRAIIAFHDGTWYMVFKATSCELCEDGTWVPVMCSADDVQRVLKQTVDEMEENFNQFYLKPLECAPKQLLN